MGESENGLKRQIGLFGAVAILVGAVIGSGIFMTPGIVAASAESFGPFMVAWILAGASGILCSLVYAELSPAMPKAGGPYVYITEAFGNGFGFVYGWSMTIGNYIPLVAMLATGFASNLAKLIPGITPVGIKMVASAVIIALMILNTTLQLFKKKYRTGHFGVYGSNYLNGHCFVSLMLVSYIWSNRRIVYLAVPLGYRMAEKESKLELTRSHGASGHALFSQKNVIPFVTVGTPRKSRLYC